MLNRRSNTFLFILGVILFFLFRVRYELSWWILVVLIVFWLALTVIGSFRIQGNYHLKAIHQNMNVSENVMALTFDDGPTPFTDKVLDLLKKYNQKATFFCIGKQVEKFPEITQRIVEEGHTIGNHTYSHSKKTGWLSVKQMISEIENADMTIQRIVYKKPKFYRPPFGVTNPSIEKAVKETGHEVIGWTIRSLDTIIQDKSQIFGRIMRGFGPGKIVLMHDTSSKTVLVLEELLKEMKRKSYESVTVDTLFKINAYEA